MKIDKRYIFKQTFWMYTFAYLAAPLGYLIRVIYARSFAVEEFGLIYSIIGLISLISIFNDFGFTETLNYHATRFYEKKEYSKVKGSLIFAFLMQCSTALILALLFYFLSPYLAEHYFRTEIAVSTFRWFLLYLIFFNISRPIIQIFVATHNYYYGNLAEFLRNVMVLVLSGLMIFYAPLKTTDYVGAVWGISVFSLVALFYFLSKKKFPEIYKSKADLSRGLYRKLFNYAIIVIVGNGAMIFLSTMDVVLLTYLRNLYEVGLYSIALALALVLTTLTGPMVGIVFPLVSKLNVNKDNEGIKKIIGIVYNTGLYLILPALVIFVVYPSEIISLLFGGKYTLAANALIVLSFAYFLNVFGSFNFQMMAGLGLIKERMKIFYISAFVNFVADVVLILSYGMIGAALGTLITMVVLFSLSYHLIARRFAVILNKKAIGKTVASSILIFFIIYFLKGAITTNIFIEIGIILAISGSIYASIGHFWGILDYRELLKMIKEGRTKKSG
ncbi:MAG: oligosaccharide flippase family protein [archaeon]